MNTLLFAACLLATALCVYSIDPCDRCPLFTDCIIDSYGNQWCKPWTIDDLASPKGKSVMIEAATKAKAASKALTGSKARIDPCDRCPLFTDCIIDSYGNQWCKPWTIDDLASPKGKAVEAAPKPKTGAN